MTRAESAEFDALVEFLRSTRSFDFKAYKKSTLMRRVRRRMSILGIEAFGDYHLHLENEPEEFVHLFNTVLINVTTFFRDTTPWELLRGQIIPKMLEQKRPQGSIRVWSAGCATGEEAFTLAMMFADVMGMDAFRSRVKIYATDVDEDALSAARAATFTAKDVENIPPATLERYFEPFNGRLALKKELRRSIIFGRHDLLQDAPISRVDILVCRNTLMYFTAPAQARILARLHFALTDGGILMLGRAETLLAHSSTFKPVDLKLRIFSKIPGAGMSQPLRLIDFESDAASRPAILRDDVRDAAFNGTGLAHMVVDRDGDLLLANDAARKLFKLSPKDINRPFHELDVSFRPVELRSLIEQVYAERRPAGVKAVELKQPTGDVWLDAQVIPLVRRNGDLGGVSVVFTDVSATKRLQAALETAHADLQTAYEELQSTHEEMETTNEELQSTVEELETTNEELQATNEELETMNEELQATNEELHSVNDVARGYNDDLDVANQFLESIFSGLGHRVIVVDPDLAVMWWNKGAEDLWGVRQEEASHRRLPDLDIGLPLDELDAGFKKILDGTERRIDLTVDARNRRGKPVECRVSLAPLMSRNDSAVQGVIILTDIDEPDARMAPGPRLHRA